MDNGSINFDQLQEEIDEAERYLRQEVLRTREATRIKDDRESTGDKRAHSLYSDEKISPQSGVQHTPTSSTSRYSDPVEREKLLRRLLAEHGSKSKSESSSPSSTDAHQNYETYRGTSSASSTPNVVNSSSFGVSRSENTGLQDTLFFASDITPNKDHSDWVEASGHTGGNFRSKSTSPPTVRGADRHVQRTRSASTSATRRPASGGKRRVGMAGTRPGRGRQYLKTREEIVEEAEREFAKKHTFRPCLATRDDNSKQPEASSRSRTIGRIDAMLRAHEQSVQRRDKLRVELERAEVEQTCTFKPRISDAADDILRASGETETRAEEGRAADRLYRYAEKRAEQQRVVGQKLEAARRADLTFQPSINPGTRAMVQSADEERVPIHERVGDLQREAAINRQILLECHEHAQADRNTFNPEINPRSRRMVEDKRKMEDSDSVDVGSRLMGEARAQQERRYKLLEEREKEMAQGTKDPKPCRGSSSILQNNPALGGVGFMERQRVYCERVRGGVEEAREMIEKECGSWFRPELAAKTEDILSSRRPKMLEESEEERVRRLHQEDAENIDLNRRRKEEEIYGAISFVPDIDPVSRALGRSAGIEELVENRRGRRVKDSVRRRVEQQESAECSFRPHIKASQDSFRKQMRASGRSSRNNLFSPHVAWEDVGCPLSNLDDDGGEFSGLSRAGSINMREPERMARDIRYAQMEREEKRRQELIAKEIEELKECTFKPQINTTIKSNSSKPVVVRGLGRHFELRNLLQRQKEIAAQREAEAFRVKNADKYRSRADGRTIVEPFHLHDLPARKSRASTEIDEEREANLTFSPTTNDSKRRSTARKLVQFISS